MWYCAIDGVPQPDCLCSLILLEGELPQGGEMQCGKVTGGSKKVMHLEVFLKPPGLGVGMVKVSISDCAARLGTLNSRIPKHSDVAYESRKGGLLHLKIWRTASGIT